MKKIILICMVLLLSGCADVREKYIECKAGEGTGDNYYLEYNVYLDFGNPSLEETIIYSKFENKEEAYIFSKKYENLITNNEGTVDVKRDDGKYKVTIKKYTNAEYKTVNEYKEKAANLNKKEKVCNVQKGD